MQLGTGYISRHSKTLGADCRLLCAVPSPHETLTKKELTTITQKHYETRIMPLTCTWSEALYGMSSSVSCTAQFEARGQLKTHIVMGAGSAGDTLWMELVGPMDNSDAHLSQHPRKQAPKRISLSESMEILFVALRLGLTSFGGPIAHLGYFQEEYVRRRKWLDDKTYADLVALCQFLPGPASSQVGISIGMLRGGYWGGVLSWLGFTIPSALALALFATFLQGYDLTGAGWLRGLLIVAVAVVAHAVWGMATKLTPDRERVSIAILAAITTLMVPIASVQILVIAVGGLTGWLFLRNVPTPDEDYVMPFPLSHKAAVTAWVLFFGLLIGLPSIRQVYSAEWIAVLDSFFRVGSLVFGGGHVVLPLLSSEVVATGWITEDQFLVGYGAAQAVPGPLFTFAAYIGAAMQSWFLSAVALVGVFAPSFLLVTGVLPFWDRIRRRTSFRAALNGINAAVVGILIAALYDPIWTKAIHTPADFSLALVGFAMLMFWKVPSWIVVLVMAAGGVAIGSFL